MNVRVCFNKPDSAYIYEITVDLYLDDEPIGTFSGDIGAVILLLSAMDLGAQVMHRTLDLTFENEEYVFGRVSNEASSDPMFVLTPRETADTIYERVLVDGLDS